MTGYALAFSACIGCGQAFFYNPVHVPSSSAVTGEREPICPACVGRINDVRRVRGLPVIVPHPDAYNACSEGDLG